MKKQLRHHLLAYLVLVAGLLTFALAYVSVWPDHKQMRWVALGLVVFYFFWGTITHVKTKHITTRVVYEYATISLLAGLALTLVTL